MIHLLPTGNAPLFFEAVLTFLLVLVAAAIVFIILCIGARILQEGYAWVTDGKASRVNILDSLFSNVLNSVFNKHDDGDYRLWIILLFVMESIIFYEIATVLGIVFAIMYLTRFTVRIKTMFSKHVEDKNAHK